MILGLSLFIILVVFLTAIFVIWNSKQIDVENSIITISSIVMFIAILYSVYYAFVGKYRGDKI